MLVDPEDHAIVVLTVARGLVAGCVDGDVDEVPGTRMFTRRRELEDVGLKVRYARVCLDDLAQRAALAEDGLLGRSEALVEVEETVSLGEPCELLDEDRRERLAHVGAGDVILC